MSTLHTRYRMRNADERRHGLTWADIEPMQQPRKSVAPIGFALAGAFVSGALVGLLVAVVVVAAT